MTPRPDDPPLLDPGLCCWNDCQGLVFSWGLMTGWNQKQWLVTAARMIHLILALFHNTGEHRQYFFTKYKILFLYFICLHSLPEHLIFHIHHLLLHCRAASCCCYCCCSCCCFCCPSLFASSPSPSPPRPSASSSSPTPSSSWSLLWGISTINVLNVVTAMLSSLWSNNAASSVSAFLSYLWTTPAPELWLHELLPW